MKIGDRVEVIAVRVSLPPGWAHERVFPVAGIDNGLLELHMGEVVCEEAYMHSI